MSPHGADRVDDALSTIVGERDAGLAPTPIPDSLRFGKCSRSLCVFFRSLKKRCTAKPAPKAGLEHILLEPIAPSIGTVVHGVDLASLSEEEVAYIRQVWLERKVVFFRNQEHLTHGDMDRLARSFGVTGGTHGELENEPGEMTGSVVKKIPGVSRDFPHIVKINSSAGIENFDAAPGAAGSWHSEVSWARRPPMATMLLARQVPPVGGDTMFCDAYAMYEGLAPKVKEQCQGLRALHAGAPHHGIWTCEHPVLRTHPETGGTTLNVSPGFTRRILGVSEEESQSLLSKLQAQAGAPEYTCRFRWEAGSMAVSTATVWPSHLAARSSDVRPAANSSTTTAPASTAPSRTFGRTRARSTASRCSTGRADGSPSTRRRRGRLWRGATRSRAAEGGGSARRRPNERGVHRCDAMQCTPCLFEILTSQWLPCCLSSHRLICQSDAPSASTVAAPLHAIPTLPCPCDGSGYTPPSAHAAWVRS